MGVWRGDHKLCGSGIFLTCIYSFLTRYSCCSFSELERCNSGFKNTKSHSTGCFIVLTWWVFQLWQFSPCLVSKCIMFSSPLFIVIHSPTLFFHFIKILLYVFERQWAGEVSGQWAGEVRRIVGQEKKSLRKETLGRLYFRSQTAWSKTKADSKLTDKLRHPHLSYYWAAWPTYWWVLCVLSKAPYDPFWM